MPLIFETEKIDKVAYTKLIRRQIIINLGLTIGQKFINDWNIVLYPLSAAENFTHFFDHVELETNLGIAWGVAMPKTAGGGDIYVFINDTKNPFILRSNFTKISHELAHAILYTLQGSSRCVRDYADPAAAAGTWGPCYVTKVHDQFYGLKKFRTYYVRYGIIWLPVRLLDIHNIITRA